MFKLVTATERVVIEPSLFGHDRRAAYKHALNAQYAGRVVRDCGLVVGVWEVVSIGIETLQPSCGRAVADVVYRLVVFAPFRGEAIYATIGGASSAALMLALSFFGGVRIPPSALPPGTTWDTKENVWVYRPGESEIMNYLDTSNDVVARVTNVEYAPPKTTPPPPVGNQVIVEQRKEQPMRITAALHDPDAESQGLGDPLWWLEEEYEGEDGDEEMADKEGGEEGDE